MDFTQSIASYGRWKAALIGEIEAYRQWLDVHEMSSAEVDLRIYELLEALRSDRLTVAFVAEFSRGKTELINAVFFAGYQRRLLPSGAGRTTMCPTELFHDAQGEQPYIRLLPIETRLQDKGVAEFKREPMSWVHIPLNIDSPEEMAQAFQEIVKSKQVPVETAQRLGLYDEQHHELAGRDGPPTEVEIPMWRHALINFPHPLLQQGLVVLDTPGLNALGSEPELTLNMLPNAQAILFVLDIHTGVTKSDLEMWQHHIKSFRTIHERGLLVVLNKIDTLWDELKDARCIEDSIHQQCAQTAHTLGVDAGSIFPVSAQKALLAKIRDDQALLDASRILALEHTLAKEVVPYKQHIVQENIINEIGAMIEETRSILAARHDAARKQLAELSALRGKNLDVIQHLMRKTREEQVAYHKNVESFQASRRVLQQQAEALLNTLSIEAFDKMIAAGRADMSDAWTTHGLKNGMKTLFDGAQASMQRANQQAEQIRRLIQNIYRKFHEEHGLADIKPKVFSIKKYTAELERLHQEAEAFRKSPVTTMTEKYFVIKTFFISMVSHARNILFKANRDARNWTKVVMAPLVSQIKEHKRLMEKRLESLRKISESHETLDTKINELEQSCADLEAQLATIGNILNAVNAAAPTPDTPFLEPTTTVQTAALH